MRTIEQFKAENSEIIRLNTNNKGQINDVNDKAAVTKANKAVRLNNRCIEALEQGMTEEKLTKQLHDLQDRINYIDDVERFETWEKSTPCTWKGSNLNHYRALNKRSTVTGQITFLDYILQ